MILRDMIRGGESYMRVDTISGAAGPVTTETGLLARVNE